MAIRTLTRAMSGSLELEIRARRLHSTRSRPRMDACMSSSSGLSTAHGSGDGWLSRPFCAAATACFSYHEHKGQRSRRPAAR